MKSLRIKLWVPVLLCIWASQSSGPFPGLMAEQPESVQFPETLWRTNHIALARQDNNLNVTTSGTHIPIRPHVNLNATINVGVKARTFHDIDLSQTCRADERIKVKGKREWRCRQDR